MQGKQVRLRTVGLPEGVRAGRDEGVGAAGGLVGGDGPGSQGGDLAEVQE